MGRTAGKWLRVEIIDVFPTSLGHCPHFNLVAQEFSALGAELCPLSDQTLEYPRHVVEAHRRVAEVIQRMKRALEGLPINVSIDLIEATSLRGTLKGIRHRLKHQWGLIVNGRKLVEGYPLPADFEAKIAEVARSLLG